MDISIYTANRKAYCQLRHSHFTQRKVIVSYYTRWSLSSWPCFSLHTVSAVPMQLWWPWPGWRKDYMRARVLAWYVAVVCCCACVHTPTRMLRNEPWHSVCNRM